jgi:PAS domain S-box-containing protein
MTRLLIVDDHPQNLYLLQMLLQAEGWHVDEARDGAQALVQARLARPDLILSDLLMPGMDGYALLRHWKADADLAAIPFIVYTATYTDPQDERLALAMGADAFLVKPADPEALVACVHALLARARNAAAPVVGHPASDDRSLLAQYNEVLVRKLEKRTLQLEQRHRDLQDSEERFRATFEQAAVGIAHVSPDGRFLRVNDKLCEITGYERAELLALDIATLTLPDDLASSERARQALLAGTQRQHAAEKRYRRKDGSTVWVSLVSTLLSADDGQARYFISVVTDISERKALEEQFRQAQKLESVGQLTGGIAHDFNNLLTVILGNAELLVEQLADDDTLRPLAEMTLTAAGRGAEMTQRLLAFARRQVLDPQAVDVNALLLAMHGMLRRMLPENIAVRLVRGAQLPPALVDAPQLEAAVLNLSINARDAMPAGGCLNIETAMVEITGTQAGGPDAPAAELQPGAYVVVTVSDTGTGIPAADLPRVFDPFFTTKPVGKGTGLGLSMVYGFVSQSHGHVAIQSEMGQGSTVRLYLPCAAGDRTASAADASSRPPAALQPRGAACILLVEDDELVRRYAEGQLVSLGYRVLSAGNGAEALAIFQTQAGIDLLLTDVVMPGGMDGPQLADALRALMPGLKVLFSSGYADAALVHDGRLDPGVNLLGKPYRRQELALKLQSLLGS